MESGRMILPARLTIGDIELEIEVSVEYRQGEDVIVDGLDISSQFDPADLEALASEIGLMFY